MNMKRISGFSLVEMAVVLAVLGLTVVAGAKLYPRILGMNNNPADRMRFVHVDDALIGFVFSHGRLPCPDANHDGQEDCSATTLRGELPYLTLGLASRAENSSGIPFTYAVNRKAGGGESSAPRIDLAARHVDRQLPLLPTSGLPPVALETTLGAYNTLDLCEPLHGAMNAAVDSNALHTGSGSSIKNVAWVLVDPGATDANGDGKLLDGSNGAGIGFEQPERPGSASYDDVVESMDFSALWARLGCGAAFSAAGHAHPDVALSAAVMHQAMSDYQVQLNLMVDMAAANVTSAQAGVAIASAGLTGTAGAVLDAAAKALVTAGATSPSIAAAAVAVAANAAAVAAAAVALSQANQAKTAMVNLLNNFNNTAKLPGKSQTLAANVRQNAVNADKAGLYVQ